MDMIHGEKLEENNVQKNKDVNMLREMKSPAIHLFPGCRAR